MGPEARQSPNSTAVLVVLLIVFGLLAVLGAIVVVGVGSYVWLRASRVAAEARAEQARDEASRALARARQEAFMSRLVEQAYAPPTPRVKFEVSLDRVGQVAVDGEVIELDELRARLAKLKSDTGNGVNLRVSVDENCPHRALVSVLDACSEVGEISVQIGNEVDAELVPEADDSRPDK